MGVPVSAMVYGHLGDKERGGIQDRKKEEGGKEGRREEKGGERGGEGREGKKGNRKEGRGRKRRGKEERGKEKERERGETGETVNRLGKGVKEGEKVVLSRDGVDDESANGITTRPHDEVEGIDTEPR